MNSSSDYYYSNHNFFKQRTNSGSVYLDLTASVNPTVKSKNIILYGKNMADGTVFGSLDKYADISYYIENPFISFDTVYSTGSYVIFSAFDIKSDDTFNYRNCFTNSDNGFETYLNVIKKRSYYNSSVECTSDDEILTLVTDTKDGGRFVVFAKKIQAGKFPTVSATLNT
jgi:sortase B